MDENIVGLWDCISMSVRPAAEFTALILFKKRIPFLVQIDNN